MNKKILAEFGFPWEEDKGPREGKRGCPGRGEQMSFFSVGFRGRERGDGGGGITPSHQMMVRPRAARRRCWEGCRESRLKKMQSMVAGESKICNGIRSAPK